MGDFVGNSLSTMESKDWRSTDIDRGDAGTPSCEAMSVPYGLTGMLSDQELKQAVETGTRQQ